MFNLMPYRTDVAISRRLDDSPSALANKLCRCAP